MSGIGKFPFINASDEKINFDQLTVGQQETKHITLRNYSLVTSKFEIEKIAKVVSLYVVAKNIGFAHG